MLFFIAYFVKKVNYGNDKAKFYYVEFCQDLLCQTDGNIKIRRKRPKNFIFFLAFLLQNLYQTAFQNGFGRKIMSVLLRKWICVFAVSLLCGFASQDAFAVNFYDGSRARQGLYFLTYTYGYFADETADQHGKKATRDFGLLNAQEILRLCYYSPDFVATIVVPFGYTKISSLDQESFGLGDISVGAGYFLPVKQVDILPMVFIKFPTGEYRASQAANIGSNQLDIAPMVFAHKTIGKFSIDAAVRYYFRFENKATNVVPGDELRLEGLVGYSITEKFRLGPSVTWMISKNREQNGTTISGSARERLSAGADFYYRFSRLSVTLTYLYDVYAENLPKGHFLQLKAVYRF